MKLELIAALLTLSDQLGAGSRHNEVYPAEWSWLLWQSDDARDSLILHLYQSGEVCLTHFDGFFLSYGFSFWPDLEKINKLDLRKIAATIDKEDLVKSMQNIMAKSAK